MNILYIIGNGFDKAQGLATSYYEFYEYLKTCQTDDCKLLADMLEQIDANSDLWSDMELALGKFTEHAKSASEYEELYFKLTEHLQYYLKVECDKFNPSEIHKNKIIKSITSPELGLKDLDRQRFRNYLNTYISGINVSIVTLNYTNTIEVLLNATNKKFPMSYNSLKLNNIIHIHGELGGTIIVGVDNHSQISNADFQQDEDVKDFMIKSQSNNVMKNITPIQFSKLIKDADIFVLFGVSLGSTDKSWWEKIGAQMKQRGNTTIINHIYDKTGIRLSQMQKLGKLERAYRDYLFEIMNIKSDDKLVDRVFLPINSDIFNI